MTIKHMAAAGLLSLTFGVASASPIVGINFNNSTTATAQNGSSTFGAVWTDVNATSGNNLVLNGTATTANIDWNAAVFWQAGSSTGTGGGNSAISTMRVYLDDSDALSATAAYPSDMGVTATDHIGVTVRLQGLSAWMLAEHLSGYNITMYSSSDNASAFQPIIARNGSTTSSTILETLAMPILGNGRWNGSAVDAAGNSATGVRGNATFASTFSQDTLTFTVASRSGTTRGTLAAIVINGVTQPVPEPEIPALLLMGGAISMKMRRRSK